MKPYTLVIDFETANPSPASACSVGLVVLEGTRIVHQAVELIQTPTPVFYFTSIHGITWNDVKSAPTFDGIWRRTIEPWFLRSERMVAHNVGFDHKVLRASARHYGIEIPPIPTECTVKLARYKLGIKPANLRNVSDTLGIELNHHEALSDARASAMIYIHATTGERPWETAKEARI
ncbi:MAG: exonuclease [Proteobacteria bacterium]|nr:exonuclease [Pseudomonadota bacterium]